ncbi:hypothetical protein LPJ66_006030 [Kickxella alabastrina]|uniref:Uncharacterized protein n=1 Tax=Kickxella alabastrina TaxID=61397 RepID=A0ACC1ICW7_9FUNG|nr:hypothetical protein LPJ66_006030 [Kickxella alabastrina]
MYFPSTNPCSSGSITTVKKSAAPSCQLTLTLHTPTAPASAPAAPHITIKSCLKKACMQSKQDQQQPISFSVPRFVHFDTTLEHTRLFYKAESPKQASSDPIFNTSSPRAQPMVVQGNMIMTPVRKPTPSFLSFEASPVVLESVTYSAGAFSGTIKVHNLDFEKTVLMRLSKDAWKTFEDVEASFVCSIVVADGSRPGVDRFRFSTPLNATAPTEVAMCVCYRVGGQEHWDNNNGANYLFKLTPAPASASAITATTRAPSSSASGSPTVVRKSASESSYGFGAPTVRRASKPPSPTPASTVSSADTRRYMRYSENLFSSAAAASASTSTYTAGLPMFSTSPWSMYGELSASDVHREHSSMCAGSPLSNAHHAWSPFPTTLLHC